MTDTQDPGPPPEDIDPFQDLNDLTGGEPLPPLEDPSVPAATPPRSPLLTGFVVALLLIILSVAFFALLRPDDEGDAAPTTTVPTTEAPESPTDTTEGPTDTTLPSETTAPTDTTVPPQGPFDPYEAVGEPIPVGELTMGVDAIGPIELGSDAADAVGRLISSLGDPDEDSGPVTSTGAFGVCEGDTERTVRLGALVAVVVVDPDGRETFGGYRLDLAFGGLDSPAVDMKTLSGLGVGDSVRRLQQVYEGFDIQFLTDPELGDVFELRSGTTGNLLLWGPVNSPEPDGFVRGIYSPDACGRF